MNEMPQPIPSVPCQCSGQIVEDTGCLCGISERVLRAVKNGDASLTVDQREWCLKEIGQVEGWDRRDFERETDHALAGTVLDAWNDFCHDKGLL